jgi:hypothetical protein
MPPPTPDSGRRPRASVLRRLGLENVRTAGCRLALLVVVVGALCALCVVSVTLTASQPPRRRERQITAHWTRLPRDAGLKLALIGAGFLIGRKVFRLGLR